MNDNNDIKMEEKPAPGLFKSCGCSSLLMGILFILSVLTLVFGWDIEGKHYGVGCDDNGIRVIWGEEPVIKEPPLGDEYMMGSDKLERFVGVVSDTIQKLNEIEQTKKLAEKLVADEIEATEKDKTVVKSEEDTTKSAEETKKVKDKNEERRDGKR